MPTWYYRGKTTTPVDIPGRGIVVIRPRTRFEAPESAVAHLKSLVVRQDPPTPPASVEASVVSVLEIPAEAPAPERRLVQEAPMDEASDSDHSEDVVESDPSSQAVEAEADQADESPVSPVKEKKKQRRSRKDQP